MLTLFVHLQNLDNLFSKFPNYAFFYEPSHIYLCISPAVRPAVFWLQNVANFQKKRWEFTCGRNDPGDANCNRHPKKDDYRR